MAALYDDIAQIELRRLAELEKQAAMHGPNTEPAVLIEIQELRHKHGAPGSRFVRSPGQRDQRIDYDFLMNTVAGVLRRVIGIEDRNAKEDKERPRRQLGGCHPQHRADHLVYESPVWFLGRLPCSPLSCSC